MIREAREEELSKIVEMEEACFPTSAWDYDSFLYEFNENPFGQLWVYEVDEQLVGYVDVWVMFEQAQIATIGVDPKYRKKGYGKDMMLAAIEHAKKEGCEVMTLEVRVSNQAAIGLYESCGFEKITLRKDYYEDNHEDAWLMMKGLI